MLPESSLPPFGPILANMNAVHILTSHLFIIEYNTIQYNILYSSDTCINSGLFSLKVSLLFALAFPPTRATWPVHHILLDSITTFTFGEEC
jgi:hypothetical protein